MKTSGILAAATILSPLVLHTLVAASTFAPLPELAVRGHAVSPRPPEVLLPVQVPEVVSLGHRRLAGDGGYAAPTSRGRLVALTLDRVLQPATERLLRERNPALGAIVVMGLDGRVLAIAGRSEGGRDRPDLAVDPWAPSASVFKVVT